MTTEPQLTPPPLKPLTPHKKRHGYGLFIALSVLSTFIVCLVLAVAWMIPIFDIAMMHSIFPWIIGGFCGSFMLLLGLLMTWLVYSAWLGRPTFGFQCLWTVTLRIVLPATEMLARVLGISVERVRHSFLQLNNALILAQKKRYAAEHILLLLPHCIQASRCKYRLVYDVDHCARCARCGIHAMLSLRDLWGIKLSVASGGTLARKTVKTLKPQLIIAVACERDLVAGIQDTAPLPVFGVLNERPNGPCVDTTVDVSLIETVLSKFVQKSS